MPLPIEPTEYEKFISLPEGTPAEFINGVICMSPSPTRIHQRIIVKLANLIDSHILEKGLPCETYVAPFDVFLENRHNEHDDCFQPDIFVACDPDKLQEDGCHGAPDWIIEIVSPSTRRRDYGVKLFKYRAAGVREYWIVDPDRSEVAVYAFESGDDATFYTFDDEIPVSICPGFVIRISSLI